MIDMNNSVGERIVLCASYPNGQKWISKCWPAVACGEVWRIAAQYDQDTILWCTQFADPFGEYPVIDTAMQLLKEYRTLATRVYPQTCKPGFNEAKTGLDWEEDREHLNERLDVLRESCEG